jgi:sulfur relay (sulfurtransferase) complex TusBCD TusD component (DsrE family)
MASHAALFSERLLKPAQRNFLLYRRVLKFLADHNPRDDLCTEARKVRAEFEEHRHEKNQQNIDFLIDRAYFWLNQYRHPEPYTSTFFMLFC